MPGLLSRRKRGGSADIGGDIRLYIDLPDEDGECSGTVQVEGWAHSPGSRVTRVEAFVDNELRGDLQYGFERPDVARAFPEAGPWAGYKGQIALDRIQTGFHGLLVRVTDEAGRTSESERMICITGPRRGPVELAVDEQAPAVPVPEPVMPEPNLRVSLDRAALATGPAWPDGHFYSPVVNIDDVWQRRDRIWPEQPELLGIEFNKERQRRFLLEEFARFIRDYDYPDEKPPRAREDQFYNQNNSFGIMDSRSLFVMLRHLRPRTMIEVGSGFSSLLTADVNRRFLGGRLDFTCIEPYPNPFLLRGISGISRILQERVEDVPLSTFQRLGDGDILFIDSSHVAKTGSDVNYLVFEILPRLRSGVVIHFHDIPVPHEYPKEWVLYDGRSWNELYVVRALLMYTTAFEFVFGASFVSHYFREDVERLVGSDAAGGGSIWLRRV